jgi:hypothetical protein
MGLLDLNRSILVVIDLQGKLAELFQVPVVLTEQNPQG